jgi:hypothetical protein
VEGVFYEVRRGTHGQAKIDRGKGDRVDNETGEGHDEVWELFLEAEQEELRRRRKGYLAKALGVPLPGESAQELERLARADQRRAEEGLTELRSLSGQISYRHIDDLTPEDRWARLEAQRALTNWLMERQRRQPPPPGSSW